MPSLDRRIAKSIAFTASWAAAALAGCGGSTTQTSSTTISGEPPSSATADSRPRISRAPTTQERAKIMHLLVQTQRIRGLRMRREVPIRIQSRAVIETHVSQGLEQQDIVRAEQIYKTLGLLPADLDVRDLLERVMGEQIVGYYDTEENFLAIRDDAANSLGGNTTSRVFGPDMGTMTIVHEMVHALQDQHVHLDRIHEDEMTTDQGNAFASLVEGDAMLGMVGYMVEQSGHTLEEFTSNLAMIERIGQSADSLAGGGAELEHAPPILKYTLVSRYIDGLVFAASAHAAGGWEAVNLVYEHVPASTEQVLHYAKYRANEQPEPITLEMSEALTSLGFEAILEDTMGELEMSVYLGLGLPTGQDKEAAAGWANDRLRIYEQADKRVAVWLTLWDTETDAQEVQAAANRARALLPEAGQAEARVERQGRKVLIVRNAPPSALSAIVDEALHPESFRAHTDSP